MMRRTTVGHAPADYLKHRFRETVRPAYHLRNNLALRGVRDPHDEPHMARLNQDAYRHSHFQSDVGPEHNPALRAYAHMQHNLNILRRRPDSWEGNGTSYAVGIGLGPYELNRDQRFDGHDPRMERLAFFEPAWNAAVSNDPLRHMRSRAFLGPALESKFAKDLKQKAKALAGSKNKEDVAAFWAALSTLVTQHGPAVGDYAPGSPRSLRHIHEFFVAFRDAIASFKYQDAYLLEHLKTTRPKQFEDIFGLFMTFEANAINEAYCPRCGMHATETQHCGEGDPFTPFRKHRAMPVPHKAWSQEWRDVFANRAEQLWYRSTEDEIFGVDDGMHTQQQAEALMRVYLLTKHRGRANTFMMRLQGSREFLTKRIVISKELQAMYDTLLDTTEHPTLLTAANKGSADAARYIGEGAAGAPASAKQLRIEYELARARRTQREEGVVRVPPAGWKIDTATVVDYRTGPDGAVANWRDVKRSLEKSIAATGLPPSAWTAAEHREMKHLQQRVAGMAKQRAALQRQLADETKKLRAAGSVTVEFPDADAIRVFDASPKTLEEFGVRHCQAFVARKRTFLDPTNVDVKVGGTVLRLDVTDHLCRQYGYAVGTELELQKALDEDVITGVVAGVNVEGAPESWSLMLATPKGPLALGTDLHQIRATYARHEPIKEKKHNAPLPDFLMAAATATEEFEVVIIGVRHGVLYGQFDGSSVAMPLGTLAAFRQRWSIDAARAPSVAAKLVEPFSWNVPFRNDWSEERLQELKEAPWARERYAPLTPNRLTPKVKRFGYTQHTTQDDFVTKEYQDRLTSKQVFTDSQKFQVFPDKMDASVYFSGKHETTKTNGVPTVDRRELEDGWDRVEAVPDHEAAAVEQAIRDISGRRPGNFAKGASERAALRLTEEWWLPFEHGLTRTRDEDRMLHPARRRREEGELPFGGQAPVLGESMGMAERYLAIVNEWSRGFDLGPHGMAPYANHAHFDTLGTQTRRAEYLAGTSILVQLFDRKLVESNLDVARWCVEWCPDTDPKALIAAVNEWRERGRPPALALGRALTSFLQAEMDAVNASLPPNAAKLGFDYSAGVVSHANEAGRTLADRDATDVAIEYAAANRSREVSGIQEYGYIGALYVEGACAGLNAAADVVAAVRVQLANEFNTALVGIIGKGILPEKLRGGIQGKEKKEKKDLAVTSKLIRSPVLAELLARLGFRASDRTRIMRGLFLHVQRGSTTTLNSDDFDVDFDTVKSWNPANAAATPPPRGSGGDGSSDLLHHGQGQQHGALRGKTMPAMLDSLSRNHDGLVLDLLYAARENKRSAGMRRAFTALFHDGIDGVFDHSRVDRAFDLYCDGRFVPTANEVVSATIALLKAAAKPVGANAAAGEHERHQTALSFFAVDAHGKLQGVHPRLLEEAPFRFENVRDTLDSFVLKYRAYGVPIGPDSITPPVLADADALASTDFSAPEFCRSFRDGLAEAEFHAGADYGFGEKLQTACAADSHLNSFLANVLKDPAALSAIIVNVCRRCLPATSAWARVVDQFRKRDDDSARRSVQSLKQILQDEAHTGAETAFRANAERYWRDAIEGRQNAASGDGRGGGSGGMQQRFGQGRTGTAGRKVPADQQQQPQQAGGAARGSSPLRSSPRSDEARRTGKTQSDTQQITSRKPGFQQQQQQRGRGDKNMEKAPMTQGRSMGRGSGGRSSGSSSPPPGVGGKPSGRGQGGDRRGGGGGVTGMK